MSRVIVLGLVIIIVIVAVLIVYSCCVVSGRSSRQEEELERICRANGLSNLENMTLENLLKAYEEDGVSFVINDGKVVDYEVEK